MAQHLDRAKTSLRIPAQRRVISLLEGEYAALHRGRSTEFNDLREYARGDDPKDLDWKASARARTLLVRRYDALRRLNLLLVISTGRSMAASATPHVLKRDLAVAVAAVVGQLAVRHGDSLGLVHGDAGKQTTVPQRGGAAHVERCLDLAWSATSPEAGRSDLAALLRELTRRVRSRCFVVIISDDVEVDAELHGLLRRLRVQHEVLMVFVDSLSATDLDVRDDGPTHDLDLAAGIPPWLRQDRALREQFDASRSVDRERLGSTLSRLRIAHSRVQHREGVVTAVRQVFEGHRRVGRR